MYTYFKWTKQLINSSLPRIRSRVASRFACKEWTIFWKPDSKHNAGFTISILRILNLLTKVLSQCKYYNSQRTLLTSHSISIHLYSYHNLWIALLALEKDHKIAIHFHWKMIVKMNMLSITIMMQHNLDNNNTLALN